MGIMEVKSLLLETMVFIVEDRTKYRCKRNALRVWGNEDSFCIASINGCVNLSDLKEFRKFSILVEESYKGLVKGYYRNYKKHDFEIRSGDKYFVIVYRGEKLVIPKDFLEDFMFVCRRFSRNWWSYYLDNKDFPEIYI